MKNTSRIFINIGILVCGVALVSYIMNHANKSEKESPGESRDEYSNVYIHNNDTLAMLISEEPGMIRNIWTKDILTQNDKDLMREIIRKFNIDDSDVVVFLYLDSSKINDESYYSYYHKGYFYKGKSIDNKNRGDGGIDDIISYCKTPTEINTLNDAIIFLAKVDFLDEKIKKYNDNSELKNALKIYKKKHFPLARKIYSENAKNELWKKNIDVKLKGNNIIFIGHTFSDNEVIDATFKEISSELYRFRFKRVSFQWYDGSETTYVDLDTKNDIDL